MSLMPALYLLPLILTPFLHANCLTLGHCPAVQCQGSVTTLTYASSTPACLLPCTVPIVCVSYIGIVCGHLVKPPPPVMGDLLYPPCTWDPAVTNFTVSIRVSVSIRVRLGVLFTWKNRPPDTSNLRVDLLSWHRHPRGAPCSLTP